MTVNEYLESDYQHLVDAANKISGNHPLARESVHYAMSDFMSKTNVADIVESGGGRFYIVAILLKCWRSKTSPFYRTYLNHNYQQFTPAEEGIPNEEDDEMMSQYELATKLLAGLNWYDRMLFEVYVQESHSISSLSRATGIPRTSVSLTIHRVKDYLQQQLKKSR